MTEEGFGDIAVAVLRNGFPVRFHHLQDPACGSSRASPYLQDANACVLLTSQPLL